MYNQKKKKGNEMKYTLRSLGFLHIINDKNEVVPLENKKIVFDKKQMYPVDSRYGDSNLLKHILTQEILNNKSIKYPISETEYITLSNSLTGEEFLDIMILDNYSLNNIEIELYEKLKNVLDTFIIENKDLRKKVISAAINRYKDSSDKINLSDKRDLRYFIRDLIEKELTDFRNETVIQENNNILIASGVEFSNNTINIDLDYITSLLNLMIYFGLNDYIGSNFEPFLQYFAVNDVEKTMTIFSGLNMNDRRGHDGFHFRNATLLRSLSDEKISKLVSRFKLNEPLIMLEVFRRNLDDVKKLYISSEFFRLIERLPLIFPVYPETYSKEVNTIVRYALEEERGFDYFIEKTIALTKAYEGEYSSNIIRRFLEPNMDVFNSIDGQTDFSLEYVMAYFDAKYNKPIDDFLNHFSHRAIKDFRLASLNTTLGSALIAFLMFKDGNPNGYSNELVDEVFTNLFRSLNQATTAEKKKIVAALSFLIHRFDKDLIQGKVPDMVIISFLENLHKSNLRKNTIESIFSMPQKEYLENRWSDQVVSDDKFFGKTPETLIDMVKGYRYKDYVSSIILMSRLGD
jgi:hypothetical protein